jgi:uncharacterized protein
VRQLDSSQGIKPLDFGAGGITGSVNQDGRLIALNVYHPLHGYVTLSAVPPFPEDQRYNQATVRAYRRSLVTDKGFGMRFESPIVKREAWMVADAIPLIRLVFENGAMAEVTTFVPIEFPVGVIQLWHFSEPALFTGSVWLQRCAYTQLTEGGPVPMPSSRTTIHNDMLENQALGTVVAMPDHGGIEQDNGSVALSGQPSFFVFGSNRQEAEARLRRLRDFDARILLQETIDHYQKRWATLAGDLLLRRGLLYSQLCCVPVEEEATCILTDHMLLPLSWNRDAYYAALALLLWKQPEPVRRHLLWMFERAERIDGAFWGRSYLANGKIKDRGFQLDQQLFPLLELADYVLDTGDQDTFQRLQPDIQSVLEALSKRKKLDAALFPTDETPGDDPIAYPYHFSSHLLLWHTLKRLGEAGIDYSVLQREVEDTIERYFMVEYRGRRLYAYASDGQGKHHLYHDANDLPLALAPAWGFCAVDDAMWQATVEFAFSPENQGGYYYGRLGSVHTPAPWALGDIQELIIARYTGTEERVRAHLQQAAQWDGAMPEAYDAVTGEVVSRHWFAWTNAAYACTMLGAFDL